MGKSSLSLSHRSFSRSLYNCVGSPYKSQCSDRDESAGGWIDRKVGLMIVGVMRGVMVMGGMTR